MPTCTTDIVWQSDGDWCAGTSRTRDCRCGRLRLATRKAELVDIVDLDPDKGPHDVSFVVSGLLSGGPRLTKAPHHETYGRRCTCTMW